MCIGLIALFSCFFGGSCSVAGFFLGLLTVSDGLAAIKLRIDLLGGQFLTLRLEGFSECELLQLLDVLTYGIGILDVEVPFVIEGGFIIRDYGSKLLDGLAPVIK